MSEEDRFRSAIPKSWKAVWAVAQYIHMKGNRIVEIGPLRIRDNPDNKRGYGDDADLIVMGPNLNRTNIEVKWRDLEFTSQYDYPYPTIFIDRASKSDTSSPHYYFTVNKSMSHVAIIGRESKDRWIGPRQYDDRVKGYPVTVYECPKDLARFEALK